MYFKIFIKYIFGYLNIRIEGFQVEKVINKIINRKIFLWNIKRKNTTIAFFNIGIKDFKNINRIIKENNCQFKIISKNGLPFVLHRYRKRKVLLITTISIAIIIIVLSRFVWNIDIYGTSKINNVELLKELEEEGLKVGALKSRINLQDVVNKIRYKRNDISWIGIELEGTNAKVRVVESDQKPEIIKSDEYCNIVSTKDGQILKLNAQNGTALVKEGDIVTKGQILIGGWMEGNYTEKRYVHSEGNVDGKIWYSKKDRIFLNQTVTEKTGMKETKYRIKFNNFTINLYKTLSKFKKYDTIYENKKIKIFSNFYLPIEVVKITNFEENEIQKSYGIEEAKEIGIKKLTEELNREIQNDTEVLQKYVKTYASTDYIEIEVIYEVKENIGTKEKIVF